MTDIFSADVQAIEPDLPVYFVFKGKTYVGQKTQTAASQMMQDAGYEQTYDFELEVRLNQFRPVLPPIYRDEIKIGPIVYRVEKVTPDQAGVLTSYGCVAQN